MIVVFLVLAMYYYSNVQVKLVESSRATCLPTPTQPGTEALSGFISQRLSAPSIEIIKKYMSKII